MKTIHLSLSLTVALAAGCASSADRAQPRHSEDKTGMAGGASAHGSDTKAQAGQGKGQGQQEQKELAATPPLMIIGVYLESALASACGIAVPPAAFFEFDSAKLDVPANDSLQQVATCLTTGPLAGRKVELIGNTDPSGNDEYNRQLGRSRAQSVAEFLEKRGVAQEKIVTRSMGSQQARGDSPSEWPLDRRVDIRLLPE